MILFPELSLTGGYDRNLTMDDAITADDARLGPLQAVADARDIVVIAGAPVPSPEGLTSVQRASGPTPT